MSMFVQVNSVEKKCPVFINLDHVIEIAPWAAGGCAIRFISDGSGSVREIRVENDFAEFKQFVLETVTEDNISKKVKELKKIQKQKAPVEDIPSFVASDE